MRYNTLTTHPMTAKYRSWEPEARDAGRVYRKYSENSTVRCSIYVSQSGTIMLTSTEELQMFGIISEIADTAGNVVMDEHWYSVQKIVPIFDAMGYVSSYRHQLALLAGELVVQPIKPPVDYPDLDQSGAQ